MLPEAVEDFSKAIRIENDFVEAIFERANTYFRLGEYRRAIEGYSRAIEIAPNQAEFYANRADAYSKLHMRRNAEEDLVKAASFR